MSEPSIQWLTWARKHGFQPGASRLPTVEEQDREQRRRIAQVEDRVERALANARAADSVRDREKYEARAEALQDRLDALYADLHSNELIPDFICPQCGRGFDASRGLNYGRPVHKCHNGGVQ